jgi:hypothetical protein
MVMTPSKYKAALSISNLLVFSHCHNVVSILNI